MQSSPGSIARFYELFVVKASRMLTGTWLCCSGHPFFADLPNIPQKQVAFFDRVFAREGDIFEEAVFDWEATKEVMLKGIFEGVQELESFAILDVPDEVIYPIALVMSAVEKSRIRVNWLDRPIGEICSKRDHAILAIKGGRLSSRAAKLCGELGRVEEELAVV